jgi:hypothetical protein
MVTVIQLSQLLNLTDPPRAAIRARAASIRSHWKDRDFRFRARAARQLQRRLFQILQ